MILLENTISVYVIMESFHDHNPKMIIVIVKKKKRERIGIEWRILYDKGH